MKDDFFQVFGRIFIASGVKGIDGKGYWYDKFLKFIPGYNFDGATFIAKTVTLSERDGNLPLDENLQPKTMFPKCVKVFPFSGSMMNAVGVSSPGLEAVLDMNIWQQREDPFLISLIPVEKSNISRKSELYFCTKKIYERRKEFKSEFGIQLNLSCPNTGISESSYIRNARDLINVIRDNSPFFIDLKVSVLFSVYQVNQLSNLCDIVTCSNTIPYGSFPDQINWKKYNGLVEMGGGGLSGKPLLPFVTEWIQEFRKINQKTPIKACGGIMCAKDVDTVTNSGANAIEIGTVKLLRPWRVKSIIRRMEKYGNNNRFL